jgi:hypothetical protein
MTLDQLYKKITKRYKPGQVVNMRQRAEQTGNIIRRFKAEIIKFYPYHVSCRVNGFIESLTYWEFNNFTTIVKG